MPLATNAHERVAWLDGLRGLAALQVVLLHYASAFLPAVGLQNPQLIHFNWETIFIETPLAFVRDGDVAVFLFFVLSGVALSYSFGAYPLNVGANAVRRIVRLGLPMAGSLVLATAWLLMWPTAYQEAATLSGSGAWLGILAPPTPSIGYLLHEIGLEGLMFGFQDTSLWPGFLPALLHLHPRANSYNPPLWTLHAELTGSFIVLALVVLRRLAGKPLHVATCACLAVWFSASPMNLFIIGHIVAARLQAPVRGRMTWVLGVVLIAAGVLLCTSTPLPGFFRLYTVMPSPPLGRAVALRQMQAMYGAVLVLFGIFLTLRIRQWLGQAGPRWLGRISFSLYLTHYPLLITAGAAIFVSLNTITTYALGVIFVTIGGIGVSLGLAALFERYCDTPSIRLSRKIFRYMRTQGSGIHDAIRTG